MYMARKIFVTLITLIANIRIEGFILGQWICLGQVQWLTSLVDAAVLKSLGLAQCSRLWLDSGSKYSLWLICQPMLMGQKWVQGSIAQHCCYKKCCERKTMHGQDRRPWTLLGQSQKLSVSRALKIRLLQGSAYISRLTSQLEIR